MGTEPGNSDPTYLTHAARKALRPKFLGADIAMTGVNFAVASTGALAVCTNEGNADLGTSFPDLHIAIMGLEKVIPDMRALGVFTRLLARSGTGQPVTTYTSLYRRPAPGKEIHVILVDNGRSEWLADAEHRNMLKCLRCGACMNTCPVYRRSGGYSYSYFIPGPLGINLGMLRSPKAHHGNVSAWLAVLLLLGGMPREDRPRRADLQVAPAARRAAPGRSEEKGGRQGHGCGNGLPETVLRSHRTGPHGRKTAPPATRKRTQSVERPRPGSAALRPREFQCPMETGGLHPIRKNERR